MHFLWRSQTRVVVGDGGGGGGVGGGGGGGDQNWDLAKNDQKLIRLREAIMDWHTEFELNPIRNYPTNQRPNMNAITWGVTKI